jgi:serine/threonine-protein kinase
MIGSLLAQRYELSGVIADGPAFTTYAARDKVLGRDVAVRIVKPPFNSSPGLAEELRTATAKYLHIKGQQIEAISDVAAEGDNLFLVGEITRSPSLADRIRKLAPFSVPVAVGTTISICQALEPVHNHGLAHGDITPQNIAVLANGEVRMQLTGMWEAYGASSNLGATLLPQMAPYLAPEISQGAMPDKRSDVYAIGVILFELLTGRQPYYSETTSGLARLHGDESLPSPRDINPAVPGVLNEIVRKAMAKDPSERYQDCRHLGSDLKKLQDALRFGRTLTWPIPGPAEPKPETPAPAPKKKAAEKTPAPQPVAPRMSAIRKEEEYERPVRVTKKERDVPLWMTFLIIFLGAVAISLVGIWMMLNINRPQLVPVPRIIGLTEQEARTALADSNLQYNVRSRLVSETVELGKVMDVSPRPGEMVREMARVSVTVSAGSQFVQMPDLRGMTVDKAKTILANLNLEMNASISRESDDTVDPGVVIRTIPKAKSKVERQSQITIVVNTGESQLTSTEDSYVYTLNINLSNLKRATTLRVDITDAKGTRTVHEREHDPGEKVPLNIMGFGPEAKFEIYYNDRLVKTETRQADSESTSPPDEESSE